MANELPLIPGHVPVPETSPPMPRGYSQQQARIEAAAAAIANARGGRRGMPPILNILEMLPEKLRDEVMEDAKDALAAADAVKG